VRTLILLLAALLVAPAAAGATPPVSVQRVAVRRVRPAIALLRRHHRHLRVFPSVGFSSDIGVGPELPSPLPKLTARLRR
jgi:hypothetical protein